MGIDLLKHRIGLNHIMPIKYFNQLKNLFNDKIYIRIWDYPSNLMALNNTSKMVYLQIPD